MAWNLLRAYLVLLIYLLLIFYFILLITPKEVVFETPPNPPTNVGVYNICKKPRSQRKWQKKCNT